MLKFRLGRVPHAVSGPLRWRRIGWTYHGELAKKGITDKHASGRSLPFIANIASISWAGAGVRLQGHGGGGGMPIAAVILVVVLIEIFHVLRVVPVLGLLSIFEIDDDIALDRRLTSTQHSNIVSMYDEGFRHVS